jgi:L-alanine-DL-glutamate epimerase-like enolase superfamily enzyme
MCGAMTYDVKFLKALRAVMILHIDIHYVNGPLKTKSICEHCETEWPCETWKTIKRELG